MDSARDNNKSASSSRGIWPEEAIAQLLSEYGGHGISAIPSELHLEDVTLSEEELRWILRRATLCEDESSEAAWAMDVHYLLLNKSISDRSRGFRLPGIAPCAAPQRRKEDPENISNTVDFCLYLAADLQPSTPEDVMALHAIRSLGQTLHGGINHVNTWSLQERPIAISVESMSSSSVTQEHALRTRRFHDAHWGFLLELVSANGGTLSTLPFFPAIIARGHHWSLTASTMEDGRLIMLPEKPIGSTKDAAGVRELIRSIRILCSWAEGTYWQWFKQNVLLIPRSS